MDTQQQSTIDNNGGNGFPLASYSTRLQEKFTIEQVEWALRRNKGLVIPTAKTLQCSQKTIHRYLNVYPQLAKARDEARTYITDFSEIKLIESIKRREPWAVSLWLKTKGGYFEKNTVEHVGANGGPIQIEDVTEKRREVVAGMIRVQLEAGFAIAEALKYVVSMGVPKEHLQLLRQEDLILTNNGSNNGDGVYHLPEGAVAGSGDHE